MYFNFHCSASCLSWSASLSAIMCSFSNLFSSSSPNIGKAWRYLYIFFIRWLTVWIWAPNSLIRSNGFWIRLCKYYYRSSLSSYHLYIGVLLCLATCMRIFQVRLPYMWNLTLEANIFSEHPVNFSYECQTPKLCWIGVILHYCSGVCLISYGKYDMYGLLWNYVFITLHDNWIFFENYLDENVRFIMYFRRGIECRFPFFA